MVPPFREAVEELFSKALVKVVFATETLALGINMPARSVVIESLSKFGGHGPRRPHAGRVHPAHRPGGAARIDDVGYAAVLCSPFHDLRRRRRARRRAAGALRSSFRPTYNMAVNLVRRYRREDAYRARRAPRSRST